MKPDRIEKLQLNGHEPLFKVARRALRASRDRRPGDRDAEFIRELAVNGLQALDAVEGLLRRYETRLSELAESGDPEAAHGEADEILCNALRKLGYERLADLFDEVPRWYA